MPLAIGVDIGGTKVAFALVDEQGCVVETRRVATQAGAGTSALLDRISEGIAQILVEGGSQIAGIGIGSPGQVDPIKGTVRNAVNLNWTDVALRDEIRQRLAA